MIPVFVRRHRRKITALVGIAALSYYAYSALRAKIREWQTQFSTAAAGRENLRRRFEQNQRDAAFTVAALLSSLAEPIARELPVEEITHALQAKRMPATSSQSPTLSSATSSVVSDNTSVVSATSSSATVIDVESSTTEVRAAARQSKKELWNDLKVASVARAISLIYAISLLVFFTRLQLNLLGRKNYIDSVMALARDTAGGRNNDDDDEAGYETDIIDHEVNRRFLTFSWWLLNRGCLSIVDSVKRATESVFSSLTPRTELTVEELQNCLNAVRTTVDAELQNFLPILLPTTPDDEAFVLSNNPSSQHEFESTPSRELAIAPRLEALLDEARDLIESPNAHSVTTTLLNESFAMLVQALQLHYYFNLYDSVPTPSPLQSSTTAAEQNSSERFIELDDRAGTTVKLASLLAGIARQSREMTLGDDSANQYLLGMNNLPEVSVFSAVVYSNYDMLDNL
ncbi:Peroxin-3 [Limtongia smithiae]|uniref:Peroxin-3 n=1 Tax=Limtongia smithiae TaxID=1125753 RepID=UPI0034CF036A